GPAQQAALAAGVVLISAGSGDFRRFLEVEHDKFEQAIAALLRHKTIAEASAEVGVNEKTVREWMKQPAFRDLYREVRGEILERTVAQLLSACTEAVEALKRNLACGKPAPENRAAVAILELAAKGVETLDLAEELRQVKQELEEVKRHADRNPAPGSGEDPGGDSGADGSGTPTAGPATPGPEPDLCGGEPVRGPLADGSSARLF